MLQMSDTIFPRAQDITTLVAIFARHAQLAPTTVGRRVGGTDKLVQLCASGQMTFHRARRIVRRFAEVWPADLDWPANIARPPADAAPEE